jgi:hypothetical protein
MESATHFFGLRMTWARPLIKNSAGISGEATLASDNIQNGVEP